MIRRVVSLCLFLLPASLFLISGCGGGGSEDKAAGAGHQETTAVSGPLQAFAGLSGTLDIAGGTAHIPVMKEAAARIMQAYPAINISVAGGGSGVGVQKVGEGLVQIGNTGRPLSDEEVQKYGLQSFPFAVDGVCAVVNPENPVADLSADQLVGIFAGKLTSWKEVGGPDVPIHLFTRDEASGTREVFWKKALAKGEISATANVVASNGAMKTAVAQDPAAIGYVSIGHLDASLKAPAFAGIAVSQASALDGTYPVTRKLYMNTKGHPQGLAKAFIEYILGPEGMTIVQAKGYLPVAP